MSNCLGEVFYLNSHSAKVFNNFDYWPFASGKQQKWPKQTDRKKTKRDREKGKLGKLFAARQRGNECQCCHKLSNMHNVYIFTAHSSLPMAKKGGGSRGCPDRSPYGEQVNCVASKIVLTYYLFCLLCSEANYLLATNFSTSSSSSYSYSCSCSYFCSYSYSCSYSCSPYASLPSLNFRNYLMLISFFSIAINLHGVSALPGRNI